LVVEPRVFNDFPTSTETVTINGVPAPTPLPTPAGNLPAPLPASITINDTNMVNSPPSGFTNRDDILVSADHGVTPLSLSDQNGFTVSANITLTDGSDSPRKEQGIRIDAPITGDALFEVNSDTGEIVAFGGGAPFYNFRPNIEAKYLTGQTIMLKEIYKPPTGLVTQANPGSLEYIAQLLPGGPVIDSGPLLFSNNEGGPGPDSFNVGFFDQGPDGATTPTDFINAQFNNIQASVTVPEPASLSVLLLGGFAFLGRRRSKSLA